ncbi:bifunctional 3-(3-hydroxy-phenyl)propionate/3-hydroxycinnamic acid hydroxylase MhpA [Glaciimonas sp. GG7]
MMMHKKITELPTESTIYDVVIVGCGPAGAALANLLGAYGLTVRVLDRNVGVLPIPRAVHIDGETMRIFQSMGLASRVMPIMRPGGGMHWVNAEGATLLVRAGVEGLGVHGWHNDYYFHQPELETILREGLARFSKVSLQEGVVLRTLRQDADGVELDLVATDGGAPNTLRARYVVGCDGARSTVRQWVGGEDFDDLGEHQAWLVVDAVLNRPLDLPEHSVQHCDPTRPSTSIYVSPLRRRWELMLLPGEDPKAMTEPEMVWNLLKSWVKPSQGTLERAATYMFHSLVARCWQNERVLLAGDAVHQTPPFLGQGLCAAMRDIANLGWKLAYALQKPTQGAAVLGTYGPERIPHAHAFVALAVEVGRVIQITDTVAAAERDARLSTQATTFTFPTPTLGPGLHRATLDRAAVGKVAPQFEAPDGRWSDDIAGSHYSVLLDAKLAAALDVSMRSRFDALGILVLQDLGERACHWLGEQGASAAIMRPDHYVFDLCTSITELAASLDALESWIGRTPESTRSLSTESCMG